MPIRQAGSTSQILPPVLIRSKVSAPVGMGLTGLAYNTAGLVVSYQREGAAPVQITLVTQTPTGAWVSGGFCEIDSVKLPGQYRIDVPNAAFAAGVKTFTVSWTGANTVDDGGTVDLTADDPYAAGLTAAQIAQADADLLTSAATTAGSVGKLLVDNLNATITSRASQASLDIVDDFVDTEVAAIKAKTDNLPAAPAAVGNIPTAAQIADGVLARNAKGGSDGPAASSVAAAIAGGFMKMDILGAVLTVRYADGTVAFTRTLTRAQLDAITAAA